MNICVFAPDLPYPPNRGGRADVWRRILALRALGHQVMLVCLVEPEGHPLAPAAADLAAVDAVVVQRFSFPMRRSVWRTLRQLAMAWRTPWHAATRVPSATEQRQLQAMLADFAPDLLWLDGPWFGRAVLAALQRRPPGWPTARTTSSTSICLGRPTWRCAGATSWRGAWRAGAWPASSGN